MNDQSNQNEMAVSAFEGAWQSGVVEDFAAAIPLEAQSNTELLTDLACIDLQNRIQVDLGTRVETYTAAFPQLAQDDLVLLELIRTEYSFHPNPDSLSPDLYCQRFPHLAHQIEMMFKLEFQDSNHLESGVRSGSQDERALNGSRGSNEGLEFGESRQIGRYILIERVGQGAFGYVYRARDPKLDRNVAVKIPRSNRFLMPEEIERFLRESRNAAQLDHPGIVRVFDTGRHNGTPYIVSELVEGQPLVDIISNRTFEFREVAKMVAEISEAISHAHERGVIHRDLKPSNIMTTGGEGQLQPRVMDFGLARRDQSDITVTMEGQAIGTPAYMSPEQAKGELATVGPRSDVYSLGVIFYQLLCGEVPFRGNVPMLIQQVINDDPAPPSSFRNRIPRDLETICMKAVQRRPGARYAGMQEFASDLNRWLDNRPILARRSGPSEKIWRWCRRRPAIASLLATLMISIVGGVTGITWQWRKAETARIASEADLGEALQSVDAVLTRLGSKTLDDIPQAKQLRIDVLNDALVVFQRFRERNPDEPRVAMQVANAHYQVARIHHALGNAEEAEEAILAALADYERVRDVAPDRKLWQEAVSATHSTYANHLLRQSRRKDGLEQQNKCVAIRKALHEANPRSGKFAAKFASAKADLGRFLRNPDEIEAVYDEAIDQLEKLVSKHSEIGFKRDLSRVLSNYSIYLTREDKHSKAERLRVRAVSLLEQVIADDPTDESKRASYANCCLQLVKNLRQESRVETAVLYQEKAAEAYRNLTVDFPSTPRHRERYASVLNEIASLAKQQRRRADWLEASEEAVNQRRILVILFPEKLSYENSLVEDLGDLSDALVANDKITQAEVCLREKLEFEKALAVSGSVVNKIELTKTMLDLGALLSESDSKQKLDEAESFRSDAEELASSIEAEEIVQAEISETKKLGLLSALASLEEKFGNLESVVNLINARIAIYEERVDRRPTKKQRTGLAKQWSWLGATWRKLEREDQAAPAYENAAQIYERLLDEDPDSTTLMSSLLGVSSTLGNLYIRAREFDNAELFCRRALELSKSLNADGKGESFRKTRLVLAYIMLGNVLSMGQNDYLGALDAFNQAVELLDEAPGPVGSKISFKAYVLNQLAWFLVTCPDQSFRDVTRSLMLIREAIEIEPDNANYISTLAFGLYLSGNYEMAIEKFEESSMMDEELSPLNTMMIALSQAKDGEKELAELAYKTAIELAEEFNSEPELFEFYRMKADQILGK